MYKQDLALDNLQWLICCKTQPNQTKSYLIYMDKEDLALNILQWLMGHKTQPNHTLDYRIAVELFPLVCNA